MCEAKVKTGPHHAVVAPFPSRSLRCVLARCQRQSEVESTDRVCSRAQSAQKPCSRQPFVPISKEEPQRSPKSGIGHWPPYRYPCGIGAAAITGTIAGNRRQATCTEGSSPGFTKYSAEISSHDNWFKRFFISFNNPNPRGYFILT